MFWMTCSQPPSTSAGAKDARQAIAFIDAQQYQTKGDWEGTLTNYEEALRLEPDSAEAHSNRGAAKQARGDLAGALADYNKAVELKRDLSEAYFNRGALM